MLVTRPKARITGFDLAAASAAPGVLGIFTHQNTPKFGKVTVPLAGETVLPLQDDRVHYEGQAVALVVADSLERAGEAARLVQVFFSDEPFEADFLAALDRAEMAQEFFGIPLNRTKGDVAAAWSQADVEGRGYLSHRRSAPWPKWSRARPWPSGRTGSFSCTTLPKG